MLVVKSSFENRGSVRKVKGGGGGFGGRNTAHERLLMIRKKNS